MLDIIWLMTMDNPPPDNIETIVKKVQDGDDNAFGEIVETYKSLVFNAVCRVLSAAGRATDSAEELAEDTFVKAWRNIKAFRGDCAFSTWIYRIAVNTARDSLRSERRHPTVSITVEDDDEGETKEWDLPVTSGDGVPEDALERKETIIAVRRAIEALPDEMRKIIVMRDLNDMSYADIAEVLGLELGTVKSRINRARAQLKKILIEGNFISF